ncbi:MAG: hypothetical protein DCF28_09645 [Alphaproteobacteria bacterium]|nr:MAG: hypothetical protein DCF28_09645 [Alphaproteobacteria bacterium]PZO34920.1 MAG: hypothetical protein DCE92_11305 [Alphaproteobacteria bacterium]
MKQRRRIYDLAAQRAEVPERWKAGEFWSDRLEPFPADSEITMFGDITLIAGRYLAHLSRELREDGKYR